MIRRTVDFHTLFFLSLKEQLHISSTEYPYFGYSVLSLYATRKDLQSIDLLRRNEVRSRYTITR